MKTILTFAILFGSLIPAGATTITAVANGSWTASSTWSCTCQPGNSDNIIIPAGITVTVSGPAILFLGPIITITINGTLVLNNASLQVDDSDIIRINAGGKVSATGITGGAIYSGVIPIFIANGSSIAGPRTITNGTLPVTMIFFKAEHSDEKVLLTWASASELNFDYYHIERSSDGKNFVTCGTVAGNQTSSRRIDYSFFDDAPPDGKIYYRINAIDLNGAVSASEQTWIDNNFDVRQADVFPNPASGDFLTLRLHFLPEAGTELLLVSEEGNGVFREQLVPGTTEYSFPISPDLRRGVYVLIIRGTGVTFTSRINIL